ncbi:uncharacterized protein [Rutidosis leptorrhynchoides]|uniref:uncharacterized protein n=1 Tax=Rutidosis leptorrhynchoides TaxID=125765 RepID=UPI003A9A5A72
MDHARSNSETAEENTGIPDDLRCKRSDGKQWRCHAMSMPNKTVCEEHYIHAKKRTANSAMRAKLAEKGHVKPGAFSVSHEKLLIGVATKGGNYISFGKLYRSIVLTFLHYWDLQTDLVILFDVLMELSVVKLFNAVKGNALTVVY